MAGQLNLDRWAGYLAQSGRSPTYRCLYRKPTIGGRRRAMIDVFGGWQRVVGARRLLVWPDASLYNSAVFRANQSLVSGQPLPANRVGSQRDVGQNGRMGAISVLDVRSLFLLLLLLGVSGLSPAHLSLFRPNCVSAARPSRAPTRPHQLTLTRISSCRTRRCVRVRCCSVAWQRWKLDRNEIMRRFFAKPIISRRPQC